MLLHLIDSESNDTNKKFKRAVSSAALLCSLATSSFTKSKNHFAIVEAWVVYLFTVLYAIERRLLSVTDYNQEINYAQNIILHSLRNLFEEVKDKEEFLYDDPLTDAFVYRHRLTILLGASASLGIVDSDTPTLDIERFIQKHTGELILWGESAIPFYLAIYFFYKKRNEYEKANAFLERTFEQTIYAIKTPGTFFPDVYVSAEKAIEMNLPEDNDREELITPRIGFILEPLICMLASLGLREALARNWYEVSKCIFSSTEMDYPFDFYKWRITGGNHINRHPQQLQRWSELVNYAKRFEINKLPKTLLKFKEWIPLFLIVYPHRINSNLVKWAMTSEITEI